MNRYKVTIAILLCCLALSIAIVTAIPTRGLTAGEPLRVATEPDGDWAKMYFDKDGPAFLSISSSTVKLGDGSEIPSLWVGDGLGATWFSLYNPGSIDRQSLAINRLEIPPPHDQPMTAGVNDIVFGEKGAGFLVKGNGIYSSVNRGFTWKPAASPLANRGSSVATIMDLSQDRSDPQHACIVGMYSRPPDNEVTDSLLQCTNNFLDRNGARWIPQSLPTKEQLYHAIILSPKLGWAVGTNGTILKLGDDGKWNTSRPGLPRQVDVLTRVYFANESKGWIVGSGGSIWYTDDGGVNWKEKFVDGGDPRADPRSVSALLNEITFESIDFTDSHDRGWIVGDQGTIVSITIDTAGVPILNFVRKPKVGEPNLYAIAIDDEYCWAVGSKSTILRYKWQTNGSEPSRPRTAPTKEPMKTGN